MIKTIPVAQIGYNHFALASFDDAAELVRILGRAAQLSDAVWNIRELTPCDYILEGNPAMPVVRFVADGKIDFTNTVDDIKASAATEVQQTAAPIDDGIPF